MTGNNNTKFVVWSPKGGVGTTTTVAGLSCLLASKGVETLAVGDVDLERALGLPPSCEDDTVPVSAGERLSFSYSVSGSLDLPPGLVIDAGSYPEVWLDDLPNLRSVMMVRACYLAIQAVKDYGPLPENTAIINIREPNRALRFSDVLAVFPDNSCIIDLPYDPAVSRSVDSGLMIHRSPVAFEKLEGLFDE